ncbi:hypothetical protein PV10_03240 [Exophiala mesophila]|uniref:Uncharacterized protein n=1 Tax=Exophiala mesophila TaxID=212818 RepID=A0A0D1X1H2_EXOME|nr:uncharacterized protein PV10_03240 [Exophiala mesophila]KIV95610.1 hypothetical protein PV10_03240 [Exophiala mesophila]
MRACHSYSRSSEHCKLTPLAKMQVACFDALIASICLTSECNDAAKSKSVLVHPQARIDVLKVPKTFRDLQSPRLSTRVRPEVLSWKRRTFIPIPASSTFGQLELATTSLRGLWLALCSYLIWDIWDSCIS